MAKNYSKSKGRATEKVSFAGIPRVVIDNPDFINLGGNAVKLLILLVYQFNGRNNGNLTAAFSYMKVRGFNSKSMGGFLDLVLCKENGHNVQNYTEANELLGKLRGAVSKSIGNLRVYIEYQIDHELVKVPKI